jgi:hypothetical protein
MQVRRQRHMDNRWRHGLFSEPVRLFQHTESAKLWGDSGMLGGEYRAGGTQYRGT